MKQAALHQSIQHWYQHHGRLDLPWRNTEDNYLIYLSEIMLQQTQVKTVLERYYFQFLDTFPSLSAVANAPLDQVLKQWQGLGYYNRAKNLHRTAQITQGELPSTVAALQALPGIGKNTAHALASFAFGHAVPIMEANVKRVLSRMHKLENPTASHLWELAAEQLDKENTYTYNQAMMDIGATVCKVKAPQCQICPVADFCKGKSSPEIYPRKRIKKVPTREHIIVIRHHKGKLALIQREGNFCINCGGFRLSQEAPAMAEYLGEVQHQYTHFKLRCRVYALATNKGGLTRDKINALAISKVDEKIIALWDRAKIE